MLFENISILIHYNITIYHLNNDNNKTSAAKLFGFYIQKLYLFKLIWSLKLINIVCIINLLTRATYKQCDKITKNQSYCVLFTPWGMFLEAYPSIMRINIGNNETDINLWSEQIYHDGTFYRSRTHTNPFKCEVWDVIIDPFPLKFRNG